MGLAGKILKLTNRVLDPLSLRLQPVEREFDSRLLGDKRVSAMLEAIAGELQAFLQNELPFPRRTDFSVGDEVASFYEDYLRHPARDSFGGSQFVNLLWLILIARAVDPELIVDSGTFTGLSSWALRRGCRRAAIHSFDIDLSRLKQKTDAHYHEADWSTHDYGTVDAERSLCYFDDHVDQIGRVLQAHERGFKYLIFDDDLSVGRMPLVTASPISLPKLQFVYDETLADGEEIEWICGRQRRRFTIDRAYLDRARSRIRSIRKLPDVWAPAAVQRQNPYTLVVLEGPDTASR